MSVTVFHFTHLGARNGPFSRQDVWRHADGEFVVHTPHTPGYGPWLQWTPASSLRPLDPPAAACDADSCDFAGASLTAAALLSPAERALARDVLQALIAGVPPLILFDVASLAARPGHGLTSGNGVSP